MAATYTLISSNVLASSAASVTFSAIPSTYTDLVLRASVRGDSATVLEALLLNFNADTAGNYSQTTLLGSGSAASSTRQSNVFSSNNLQQADGGSATASTFGNAEIYIPSYTVNQNKPIGSFGVGENNATAAYMGAVALLWRNTAAITSIAITPNSSANFVSGSSFYLYGIKNS